MSAPRGDEAVQLGAFLAAALAITPMTTGEIEDAATAAALYRPGRVYTALARLERHGRVRGLRFDGGSVLWAATASALPARPPHRSRDPR